MSVLRNLEAKLGGLVEGAFSRAFKSRVEPVELARKLAKEMEESKKVSVSRVYVPNHYRVFLSPQDREQFESYEPALRKELSDYLLEHARAERLALTSRPAVEFMTDERLGSASSASRPSCSASPSPSRARRWPRRRRRRATSATRWSTRPTAPRASSSPSRSPRRARCCRAQGGARCSAARAWSSAAAATARSPWTTPTCRAGTPSCVPSGDGWMVVRPRLDQRHQGQPPARRLGRPAPRRRDHARPDRPRLRARVGGTHGRSARGGAEVRLPGRALPVPAVGLAQRAARPDARPGGGRLGAGRRARRPARRAPGRRPAGAHVAAPGGGGRARPRARAT